ncbi:MAG: hypothetical protein ACRDE2_01580 [Chitinophagaceae bacterium]
MEPLENTLSQKYSTPDLSKSSEFMSKRLYSLDALRGFDMLWIIGADELFHGLAHASGSPLWNTIAEQFTHPSWRGFFCIFFTAKKSF